MKRERVLTLRQSTSLNTPWLERLMARARLAQGDAKGAHEWIDSALLKLTNELFRSEFLELKYDIRHALGDEQASSDLEAALAASQKDKERLRLQEKLDRVRNMVR